MFMGGKYGRQARQQAKRDSAAAVAASQEGTWDAPRVEDCDDVQEYVSYPSETTRVVVHLRFVRGRLHYFALMHDAYADNQWWNVTRVDCKHKSIHQHYFDRRSAQVGDVHLLVPLHSESDVGENYERIYGLVLQDIDENERKWRDA